MNETSPSTHLDQDRAEIIAVIEEETAAWLRRDIAGWAACWVRRLREEYPAPSMSTKRPTLFA